MLLGIFKEDEMQQPREEEAEAIGKGIPSTSAEERRQNEQWTVDEDKMQRLIRARV